MGNRTWMAILGLGVYSLLAPMAIGEAPPDSDGDGVSDVADKCPNLPGHVNSLFGRGCPCTTSENKPDADCDGIPDDIDNDMDYGVDDDSSGGGNDTDGNPGDGDNSASGGNGGDHANGG